MFGDAWVNLAIVNFRGKMSISTLNAFPLQYYPDAKKDKCYLVKSGREFVLNLGAYHRHRRGTAFYMKERQPFKVSVDGRIMLDAAFFRKTKSYLH